MKPRLDQHAFVPSVILGALGVALIRLGFALRPQHKEIP